MRIFKIEFSPQALEDLKNIHEYISQFDPSAASRMAIKLVAACDSLELMPNRGRVGIEPGTRELTHIRPYIITFEVGQGIVRILNFWHHSQNR